MILRLSEPEISVLNDISVTLEDMRIEILEFQMPTKIKNIFTILLSDLSNLTKDLIQQFEDLSANDVLVKLQELQNELKDFSSLWIAYKATVNTGN